MFTAVKNGIQIRSRLRKFAAFVLDMVKQVLGAKYMSQVKAVVPSSIWNVSQVVSPLQAQSVSAMKGPVV